MTIMQRYLLSTAAAALIAVGVGTLWNYLLPFATNDWWRILVYLSMCALAVASMIGVQAALPREHRSGAGLRTPDHVESLHSTARRAQ